MQQLQDSAAIHSMQNTWHALRPARKYLNLTFVLLLGVLGYLVGPRDLLLGEYTAKIEVFLAEHTLSTAFPFMLGTETGQSVTEARTDGAYQLFIEAKNAYRYGLGQRIDYRVQVLNAAGRGEYAGFNRRF